MEETKQEVKYTDWEKELKNYKLKKPQVLNCGYGLMAAGCSA